MMAMANTFGISSMFFTFSLKAEMNPLSFQISQVVGDPTKFPVNFGHVDNSIILTSLCGCKAAFSSFTSSVASGILLKFTSFLLASLSACKEAFSSFKLWAFLVKN